MNAKQFLAKTIFSGMMSLISMDLLAFNDCSQGHCASVAEDINNFCKENGMEGKKYLVVGPNNLRCLCQCSCVATGTKISLFNEEVQPLNIEDLVLGEKLKSPFSTSSNKVGKLLASDFSEGGGKVHYMKFSNGEELVVSSEHSFVVPSMKVRNAEELTVGSVVLDGNMKDVTVLENSVETNFTGKLMNLIINEKSTKAKNHFIVTNSILSGDWLVQSNYASFKSDIDVRMGRIDTFQSK